MFGDYVLDATSAKYDNRILFIDDENLDATAHYSSALASNGYEIIYYTDDLELRIDCEGKIDTGKVAIIARSDSYVPYDMLSRLRAYTISLSELFPKLNADVLMEHRKLNLDLLCLAYARNFDVLRRRQQTEDFLSDRVYAKSNVAAYLKQRCDTLMQKVRETKTYQDWFAVAEEKADIDVMATSCGLDVDTAGINSVFKDYVLAEFGKLSTQIDYDSPVLVSRAMEYMHDHSEKFVIIVMDGMSEFDWKVISSSFEDIPYEQTAAFAMIPTTTSVSRQCLLSGKYPRQLLEPWKQSKEKAEFVTCAKNLGYKDGQIEYARGYEAEFGSFVKCGAVIINDVDDMVHGEKQGRIGMLHNMTVLADQKKLAEMVRRFTKDGFDVYISADHGNTLCTGIGKLTGTGLEVETKSHRMVVLQDFADKDALLQKYGMIDYPKYYLDKDLDYLICNVGESFDVKGEEVMTHGGISIDEVIVPFIKIKAGK